MIAYLKGPVLRLDSNRVIVRMGGSGIGYEVIVTAPTFMQLAHMNEHTFWIYTAVSENAIELFGFLAYHDKKVFELLLTVQGMGLKSAMRMLSAKEGSDLLHILANEKAVELTQIPGIGLKTAQKLCNELATKAFEMLKEINVQKEVDAS